MFLHFAYWIFVSGGFAPNLVSRNRAGLVEVWPAKIVCKAILLAGSLWKVELRLRQTGLLLRELEDPKREETESNQTTVAMPAIAGQRQRTRWKDERIWSDQKGRCVFPDRFDSSWHSWRIERRLRCKTRTTMLPRLWRVKSTASAVPLTGHPSGPWSGWNGHSLAGPKCLETSMYKQFSWRI